MDIDRIDHFVLTVKDVEATCDFYARVLGMEPVTFAGGRRGLAFGRQKINLRPMGGFRAATSPCVVLDRRRDDG